MKWPKTRGFLDRFALWIDRRLKIWWLKYLVGPLLIGLPLALIALYYQFPQFQNAANTYVPLAKSLLWQQEWIAIVFPTVYTPCLVALGSWVQSRVQTAGPSVEGLLHLVSAMDEVVGAKATRFGKYLQQYKGAGAAEVFCSVTQPDVQIAEIARAICNLFNATRPRDEAATPLIRVVLFHMSGLAVDGIVAHFPSDEPPTASQDLLSDPCSTVVCACKSKKLVVVESIQNEIGRPSPRYAKSENPDDDRGSIICYPVHHLPTNSVPLCISIHCDKDKYFRSSLYELYDHVLRRFAIRISLEYNLLLLKEKVCVPTHKN